MEQTTEDVKDEVKDDKGSTETEAPKDQTTEILKEIRDKMSTPAPSAPAAPPPPAGPTREEIRERIKAQTGYTDAQLDFHEQSMQSVVSAATAPLQEKVAWAELKEEVGKIDPEIEKEMREELKQYPANLKGDKVLLQKVYDMSWARVNRKKMAANPPPPKSDDTGESMPDNVVSRRIVSPNQGSSQGLSTGGSKSGPKLSDDERKVAKRFNMTDEEYAKFKNNADVTTLKK